MLTSAPKPNITKKNGSETKSNEKGWLMSTNDFFKPICYSRRLRTGSYLEAVLSLDLVALKRGDCNLQGQAARLPLQKRHTLQNQTWG